MFHLRTKVLAVTAALLFTGSASAEDNFWLGVKAGTLGIGAEVTWRPIDWVDFRVGGNFYDFTDSAAEAGINYDATLALDSYYGTVNFRFPLSPFRLSVGAFANNNEYQLVSQDMASYDIGNNPIPYSPADVGTIRATATFESAAPYLGVGFDFSVLDRIGFALDFGVLWQGEPTVSITADGLLGSDPALLADLDLESQQLEDAVDYLKAYPVISLGFNFNF